MAVTNRDIEKHLAELKRRMDFDGANEMRKLQEEVYQQYMKEMRSNPLWGTQTGRMTSSVSALGLTAEQVMRQQVSRQQRFSPDLDVLVTPSGRPIGPEWRGAAIVRVSLPNVSPTTDNIAVAFRSREDNVEAMVYLRWVATPYEIFTKAAFYVELLNQWRVGEVTVSIEI